MHVTTCAGCAFAMGHGSLFECCPLHLTCLDVISLQFPVQLFQPFSDMYCIGKGYICCQHIALCSTPGETNHKRTHTLQRDGVISKFVWLI